MKRKPYPPQLPLLPLWWSFPATQVPALRPLEIASRTLFMNMWTLVPEILRIS
jgi:hypothetical protein